MLWLAGLMGLMAVSAVAYVDGESECAHDPLPENDNQDDGKPMSKAMTHADALTVAKADEWSIAHNTADAFAIPDQEITSTSVEMLDFTDTQDALLFVWDDNDGAQDEPDVTIQPDPDTLGVFDVRMGDTLIAQVRSATMLTAQDLSLIPNSSAQALGLG